MFTIEYLVRSHKNLILLVASEGSKTFIVITFFLLNFVECTCVTSSKHIYFQLIQNEKLITKGLSLKIQSCGHSTFTEYHAPEIVIEAGGGAPPLVPS